jgi:hypothetical protein
MERNNDKRKNKSVWKCFQCDAMQCDASDFFVGVDPEKDDSSAEDCRLSPIIERDEW